MRTLEPFLEDFKYDNVWEKYAKDFWLVIIFRFLKKVKIALLMDSKYMHLDMKVCAVFMISSHIPSFNLLAVKWV